MKALQVWSDPGCSAPESARQQLRDRLKELLQMRFGDWALGALQMRAIMKALLGPSEM